MSNAEAAIICVGILALAWRLGDILAFVKWVLNQFLGG